MVAGDARMLCFYVAIKEAPLSQVMLIAFTAPLFGALMGFPRGGEAITIRASHGLAMTVGGIALLTAK